MDWLDLLAVQGTLKSSPTPQFKSISSSVLNFLHSPTLTSIHTTGKTIALTRQTFVGKVMSLLFNMLSRLHSISFIHLFNFFICFYCIHARIKSQIHSHWNIFFFVFLMHSALYLLKFTNAMGMQVLCSHCRKQLEFPQKTKQNYHMIQQSHSWTYIWNKL